MTLIRTFLIKCERARAIVVRARAARVKERAREIRVIVSEERKRERVRENIAH